MTIDRYGLYVQNDLCGGDSPHRGGIAMTYFALKGRIGMAVKIAINYAINCRYINDWFRHPVMWNDPKDFSRDQASRLMLGLSLSYYTNEVKKYYTDLFKNNLRHPNGDFIGVGEIIMLIRCFKIKWLYPLLIILDLKFILDIYLRNKWDGASLFIPDMIYGKYNSDTISLKLARKLAKRKPEILKEMLHNHSLEKNGCVELQPMCEWFWGEL